MDDPAATSGIWSTARVIHRPIAERKEDSARVERSDGWARSQIARPFGPDDARSGHVNTAAHMHDVNAVMAAVFGDSWAFLPPPHRCTQISVTLGLASPGPETKKG